MPDFISTNVSKQNILLALKSKIVKLNSFHINIETLDIHLIYENFSTFHVGEFIFFRNLIQIMNLFLTHYTKRTQLLNLTILKN